MQNKTAFLKRSLAIVLSLIFVISTVHLTAMAAEEPVSVTAGALVAGNYDDLTAEETAILESAGMKGDTYSYHIPEEADDLVAVDAAAKTVTAKPITKDGYTWTPSAAVVVYDAGHEDVALSESGSEYTGTFSYGGNAYHVDVTYDMAIAVDEELQSTLINGPYYLVAAYDNLDIVDGCYDNLSTISGYMSELTALVEDGTIADADVVDAINALAEEVEAEGKLTLVNMLDDYEYADSIIAYLLADGAAFKDEVSATFEALSAINNSEELADKISSLPNSDSQKVVLKALKNTIAATVEDMDYAMYGDWGILEEVNNPVKSGITGSDASALDVLVFDADGSAYYHFDYIKEQLNVEPVIITVNVNQFNVSVSVTAEAVPATAVDSAATGALKVYSAVLQVADGATEADVLAAVEASGIEAAALAGWGDVSEANYTRSASALPSAVTEDITYTISYAPKTYTVNLAGAEKTVPYGYNLKLPTRSGSDGLVYDYFIGSEHYLQGKIVRITGDTTITRTEGQPWTEMNKNKIAAEVFADEINDIEKDILGSPALISDGILIRVPTNDDGLVEVISEDVVNTQDFDSGFNSLLWTAAAVDSDTYPDRVVARYELNLDGAGMTKAEALEAVNLPKTLADEAKAQKENMDILLGQYDRLGQLDRQTLNLINVGINGTDMSEASRAAVTNILEQGSNKDTSRLYLYEYLTEYKEQGLPYYYRNSEKIREQVELLLENLTVIFNDPEFEDLLTDIGYHDYYAKIEDLINNLSAVTITDANPAIDTDSPSLADLVDDIEALIGNTSEYDTEKPVIINTLLTAPKPGYSIVTIVVQAQNSAGDTIGKETYAAAFSSSDALTAADIAGLEAAEEALVEEIGIDADYFVKDGELTVAAGEELEENRTSTFTYTPKQYTANVTNETGATVYTEPFYYDASSITLPACPTENAHYLYKIGTKEITVGAQPRVYTFTKAEIDGEAYALITRDTVDAYRDAFLTLINELNKGILDAGLKDGNKTIVSFIPVEDDDGCMSVVVRVSPNKLTKAKIQKAIENVAKAIIGSDFLYIKLGNEFLREDTLLSAQTVVDAFLNCGSSLDDIIAAINSDGSINEMSLEGDVALAVNSNGDIKYEEGRVKDAAVYGGLLAQSTMDFGPSASETKIFANIYLTIEDFGNSPSDLKNVRRAAKKARSYGNVVLHDGMIDVDVEVPDRIYQAYITAALGLNLTTLDNLDEIKLETAKDLLLNLLYFITDDETITIDTYENTAEMVDYDLDVSYLSKYYDKARRVAKHLLNNTMFEDEEFTSNTYKSNAKYDFGAFFDVFNVQETYRNLIKESKDGSYTPLVGKIRVTVNNTADGYQAIVIDKDAAGTRKLVYTRDLVASIESAHDNTIIILLDEYEGDLDIDKKLVIDLNGHTIYGDLNCGARTIILDSKLSTESGAGVEGNVTGHAVITAGTYTSDVSSMIKEGYIFENGVVRNGYYYIVEDEDGNLEIHLTPSVDVVEESTRTTFEAIAIELAADLGVNYYTAAALTVGGNNIYYAYVEDVLKVLKSRDAESLNEIIDCIDCAGVTDLANDLLDKMLDFTTVGTNIQNNQPIATYESETNDWWFEPIHVEDGDYLSANIFANSDMINQRDISVYVDDDGGVADLFLKLGEIVTADADVELESLDYTPVTKDLIVTGNANFDVTIDMSEDPNFAIAIGVILADGLTGAKRDALIEAVNTYYETGSLSDLKAAIEDVSTNEFLENFGNRKAFTEMLADTGLDSVVADDVTELYNSYRKAIVGVTKAIVKGGILNGSDTTLGTFETDEYGTYRDSGSRTYTKQGEVYDRYGVQIIGTLTEGTVTVKLFKALIIVTNADGEVTYQGDDLVAAFDIADEGSTIEVLGNVTLAEDVDLECKVELIGTEFIDFDGNKINLAAEDAELTADMMITDDVASGLDGYFVTESVEADKYVYRLEGVSVKAGLSLELQDEILINYYVYMLTGADPADCKVVFTYEDGTTSEAVLTEDNTHDKGPENMTVIAKCAAKEMIDVVNAKIYYKDKVIKENDISVRMYCELAISMPGSPDELVELCHYVLNYGADAQNRFDYKTDDLANRGEYYNDGEYYIDGEAVEIDDTYAPEKTSTGNIRIGASLNLEYRTELNFYFSNSLTYDTITVDGADYSDKVENLEGIMDRITVKGIAAKELNKFFTIYLHTTDGDECTLKYSPLSYVYLNRNNEREAAVCKALYNYYLAADAYFKYKIANPNP
ncbi:MAG: hypothetical protein IKH51_08590 [Clostridia bacterium]|nr:hypothetical protein [Clostridia bacterium]